MDMTQRPPSHPHHSMPSVVVLIPPSPKDRANDISTSASAASISAASSSSLSLSSTASPYASSAFASTSALHPPRTSPPKPRRSLLPSSSAPTLPPPSSSSSSGHGYSSDSSSSGHRSRSIHTDQLIDPSNPFGVDVFESSKRVPPADQGLYVCKWRLRDKKNLFDTVGHIYCDCNLMTADLLARHVLSQHIAPARRSARHVAQPKIACRWGSCFNRHYEPSALAAHLIHDHFTVTMGLKYACIAKHCAVKTIITSHDALHRHHAAYHEDAPPKQLRPIWKFKPPPSDNGKSADDILAALRAFDRSGQSLGPRMIVTERANPKIRVLTPEIRRMRETAFKRRFFDPQVLTSTNGQDGQPWIKLHRRLEKRNERSVTRQNIDDLILQGTEYDSDDLVDVFKEDVSVVEIPPCPRRRQLERGLQNAQLYGIKDAASSQQPKLADRLALSLPLEDVRQVVIKASPSSKLVEHICPASLSNIERKMDFDSALDKQRRWADRVLGFGPASLQSTRTTDAVLPIGFPAEQPQLLLEQYHPASRFRYPIAEDEQPRCGKQEQPHAVRPRPKVLERSVPERAASSPLTVLPTRESTAVSEDSVVFAEQRCAKRMREDVPPGMLGDEEGPPTSKPKLEDIPIGPKPEQGELAIPMVQIPSLGSLPVLIELEPNAELKPEPQPRDSANIKRASSAPNAGSAPLICESRMSHEVCLSN